MTELTPIQQVVAPVSDRLCGDDLLAGPRTIKFTDVRAIEGDRGKKQFSIRFEGDNGRPWIPCKTMARAMVLAWSITDEQQMVGRSVTVFRDPNVDFGKEKGIGGVRISHMSHLPKAATMKLTVAQGKKGAFVFEPLIAEVTTLADPAQKWATGYIAKVNACQTTDELNAFTNERAGKLAELQTKWPDLHTECVHALDLKRAALAFEPEGKPDTDMGEGFGDDEFGGDDA